MSLIIGTGSYLRTRTPARHPRPTPPAQPVTKDKISSPLELARTTDADLLVTYEGIGKNGESVQVQFGLEESLVEKQCGLLGRALPVDSTDSSAGDEIGLALSAGLEEDLEIPLNASLERGEARRRRSASRAGSMSGMIIHRVRDSISDASREGRFGFDYQAEATALGIDAGAKKTVRFTERSDSKRRGWFARTFDRAFGRNRISPQHQVYSEPVEVLEAPRSALTPPKKLVLVPFPRESPPPTPFARLSSSTPSTPTRPHAFDNISHVLPLHIEPFRVTYDSTLAAVKASQRHSSPLPPHVRTRSAATSAKKSREIGTQYSYHDFAHSSATADELAPPRRRNSIASDSHSSSHYGPTPPARSRHGSHRTTTELSESPFAFNPPPLPSTPTRFRTPSTPLLPSTPSSLNSFPLQYPSPSVLNFARSPTTSLDSVSAALGPNRSDARVLAFVEERPSPDRASPVAGLASETRSDDEILELVSSKRSSRVGVPASNRTSMDGGAASSIRRMMDAKARKRLEAAEAAEAIASITYISNNPIRATENEGPLTPPTTPRQSHLVHSRPTSPSLRSFYTAQGSLPSQSSLGRSSTDIFVVPPTPTHPLAARSRSNSAHEPLSKRFSLRYELALAANDSLFGRRGSGSTVASAGTELDDGSEQMEDYAAKARRGRKSLLEKVIGREA